MTGLFPVPLNEAAKKLNFLSLQHDSITKLPLYIPDGFQVPAKPISLHFAAKRGCGRG